MMLEEVGAWEGKLGGEDGAGEELRHGEDRGRCAIGVPF